MSKIKGSQIQEVMRTIHCLAEGDFIRIFGQENAAHYIRKMADKGTFKFFMYLDLENVDLVTNYCLEKNSPVTPPSCPSCGHDNMMDCACEVYAWIITQDHLGEGDKGVWGPSGCAIKPEAIKENGVEFKMYDDDGELYYTGKLLGGTGLEPLDDFGRPNAGCVDIKIGGRSV